MLSNELIAQHLSKELKAMVIKTYDCVDSTNDIAKDFGKNGINQALIIASEQTKGRGRRGRTFFSPKGSGIYMSILLRPDYATDIIPLLTTAAAVAVSEAIETVTDTKTSIKWINDLYIDYKKVCGILCESSFSSTNKLDFIIVGIGINIQEPKGGFPIEIADIATSLFSDKVPSEETICKLCAEITNNIFKYSNKILDRTYLDEYRKRLFILGKEVTVISPTENYNATPTDIDDNAHLIVKTTDGIIKIINAGEISLKIN